MTSPSTSAKKDGFKPDGTGWRFDSIHIARAIQSVQAFLDSDQPVVQIEIHEGVGARVIGTDSYSLLRCFVPLASGNGHETTRNRWHDVAEPDLDDAPDRILCPSDPETVLSKWATFYGKLGRLKDRPVEHVDLQPGILSGSSTQITGMEQRGVRFTGDLWIAPCPDTEQPRAWRKTDGLVRDAKPVDRPIRLNGGSASAIGKLGSLDPDKIVQLQTVVTESGFEAVRIDAPGSFPHVTGYCAAARR